MKTNFIRLFIALAAVILTAPAARAQGTAFTYQGQLNNSGQPASGNYDVAFTLYATNAMGVPIAGPVTNAAIAVSNGLFTTTVNFGPGVFTGGSNWLELAVRTNGSGGFNTLTPRQQLTPTPYAIFSANAGNATTATTAGTATSAASATTATTANNFSGTLTGDVTGTQGATVVSTVGGVTAANVASGASAANAAASANTASTIVKRDASGNFSAGTITANLAGNATTATSATSATTAATANNFSGALAGDVTGTQGATVVSANIPRLNGTNTFTGTNNFAGVIIGTNVNNAFNGSFTGNLTGNATTATSATSATTATTANNFSGSLTGDVMGTQGATVVSTVGGVTAANVAGGASAANAATSANTANTIVKRDGSGNFSAGTITANGFTGNGANLTSLNAAQLTGTISSNALSGFQSPYNTIGGGNDNIASGGDATVGGGNNNTVTGNDAFIGGGGNNVASGISATIGAGAGNNNAGFAATIGGGWGNYALAPASYAAIGGGQYNVVSNQYATIGGGLANTNLQLYGTIAGGYNNFIGLDTTYLYTFDGDAIGGGTGNTASGFYSTIPGGFDNQALGNGSFAAGTLATAHYPGSFVWADNTSSFSDTATNQFNVKASGGVRLVTAGTGMTLDGNSVLVNNQSGVTLSGSFTGNGGGLTNLNGAQVTGVIPTNALPGFQSPYNTIGGGNDNIASGGAATVSGGNNNTVTGNSSFIGGGGSNIASGSDSVIGGGTGNNITAQSSAIGGGGGNSALTPASYAVIGGGEYNVVSNRYTTIGGGQSNTNLQLYGTIAGGFNNFIGLDTTYLYVYEGDAIGGGIGNTASGFYSTVPGGFDNQALGNGSFAAGTLATAHYPGSFVWADNTSSFSDTATNQFNVQARGGVRFVTLGAGMTLDGNVVLVNNQSGVTLSGSFTGNGGGLANLNGAQITGVIVSNALPGFQSPYNTIAGGNDNIASGGGATVGGGNNNTVTGNGSFIGGGGNNVASGVGATISAGTANNNAGFAATIGGGWVNNVFTPGFYGTVGGGKYNTVTNQFATIGGGFANTNGQQYGTIGGGYNNTVAGGANGFQAATIGGGYLNVVSNYYATVPGGFFNKALGQSSFAAGSDATAFNNGSFVWADTSGGFSDTAANQFNVQAFGGARFVTAGAGMTLDGNSVVVNNQSGVTLSGSFSGNAGGLTNLNATQLTGVVPTNALPGFQSPYNTIAGGTDNVSTGGDATVGGGANNTVTGNDAVIAGGGNNIASGLSATIGGGGQNLVAGYSSAILGGAGNSISNAASYSVIGGGNHNVITNQYATIGGGLSNTNNQEYGTIGGGQNNMILGPGNYAIGPFPTGGTIGGGIDNLVTNNYATVPGGFFNKAYGQGSFAAGQLAAALYPGSFVWADGAGVGFSDTATNQFNVRANGGVRYITTGAGMTIDGEYVLTGSSPENGGSLTNLNASALASGTIPLTQLPSVVVTNNETGVTLSNLTLPAVSSGPAVIYAGTTPLAYGDNSANAYVGLAGNVTTTGNGNTAGGNHALLKNMGGSANTAIGQNAMDSSTNGSLNTAVGSGALAISLDGSANTAIGDNALELLGFNHPGGTNNIAIGYLAGANFSGNESSNIDIGNLGVTSENNTIRIGTPGIQTQAYIAGVINGNGSGLTNVNTLGVGGQLSAVTGLGGVAANTNVFLNDRPMYLRNDHNHGLGYNGLGITNFPTLSVQPDGPVLWGYTGGALGVMNGGAQAALSWDNTGVTVSNALTVAGNLAAKNIPSVSYNQTFALRQLTGTTTTLAMTTNSTASPGYFVIMGMVNLATNISSTTYVQLVDVSNGNGILATGRIPFNTAGVSLNWVAPVNTLVGSQVYALQISQYAANADYVQDQNLTVMYFPRLNN